MTTILWLLGILGYLTFGNLTGKGVAFDYNDNTDTEALPVWRQMLRRLVFPLRARKWNDRYTNFNIFDANSDAGVKLVDLGGSEYSDNRRYVAMHTFLWPLMRIIPAMCGVFLAACGSVYALVTRLGAAMLRFLDISLRRLGGKKNQGQRDLQRFQEEISSSKVNLQEMVEQIEAKLHNITTSISTAEGMKDGELAAKVAALLVRLENIEKEYREKLQAAQSAFAKVEEAEKKILNYSRLLKLYKETHDLADTNKEQDELFRESLNIVKIVRQASATLSKESTEAMIHAEVPYEFVEASIKEDVRRESALKRAMDNQLFN